MHFSLFWNNRPEPEKIFSALCEKHGVARLAHCHKDTLESLTRFFEKIQELIPIGMARVAGERIESRVHPDVHTVYDHLFLSVLQAPSQSPRGLVANKKHGRTLVTKVLFFVLPDAASARHARSRDKYLRVGCLMNLMRGRGS